VLAHELGHFRLRHVPAQLLVSCLTGGLTLLLLSMFINNRRLFDAFGVTHLSIYGSIVFFGRSTPRSARCWASAATGSRAGSSSRPTRSRRVRRAADHWPPP